MNRLEDTDMKGQPKKVDRDRRTLMLLALAGVSGLALGKGRTVLAQEAKGVERKVYKEVESVIPGFAKIRLRESIYAPGVSGGTRTMKNAMVCEMTQGRLETTAEGKTVVYKKGDVWTCKPGMVVSDVNKGDAVAIMRVFDLLPA
jgi:quercetin dioxygenase-like cupin family protein